MHGRLSLIWSSITRFFTFDLVCAILPGIQRTRAPATHAIAARTFRRVFTIRDAKEMRLTDFQVHRGRLRVVPLISNDHSKPAKLLFNTFIELGLVDISHGCLLPAAERLTL